MQFLFHTALEWSAKLVYYNVFQTGPNEYLAQVQDNHHHVDHTGDICFYFKEDEPYDSSSKSRYLDILREEVASHYREKRYF